MGQRHDITFELISGSKPIGGGSAALHDPFIAAGRLDGAGHAVSTSESHSNDNGVAQQTGSYWVAHRVR